MAGVCFHGLLSYCPRAAGREHQFVSSSEVETVTQPVVKLPRKHTSVTEQSECGVYVFRL